MVDRVESDEVLANANRFQVFIKERPLTPEQIPQDVSYEHYSEIIPGTEFGTAFLAAAIGSFTANYKKALEMGELDGFVEESVSNGYSSIYKIKAQDQDLKSDEDKRIAHHHSPDFLGEVDQELDVLVTEVKSSNQPVVYKNEYLNAIGGQLRFTEYARKVTTPDFTPLQKSPEEWAEFIDVQKSLERGEIILKYEDIARQTLELARQKREEKGEEKISVKNAIDFWQLDEEEAEYIGVNDIKTDDIELLPQMGAKLMEVLLKRIGADGWTVEIDDSPAVQVIPREEKVRFPLDRKLKGMDVIWIPSHELFHVVRAINGAKQGLKLLKTENTYNYLPTEEGSGAVAEMVAGQKFGDPRQAKMAARYFAVSQMLKADIKDGQIAPRFTPQEVYGQLKSYGVSHTDASDIVWRIQRGTSLKHDGVVIPVKKGNETTELPSAECFVKDAVYFEGQMQVFEWMKSLMPLSENLRKDVTLSSPDFSEDTLKRVGYSVRKEELGRKMTLSELRRDYNNFASLGRDRLFDILNILGKGKIRLDFLTTERNKWDGLMANSGLTDYRKIFSSNTK